MSLWQRKLDLKDVWEKADKDEITSLQLAEQVIYRLKALESFGIVGIDEDKQSIIEQFEDFILCGEDDDETFNSIFNDLYDWADISLDNKFGGKKVCWISTLI